MPELTYSGKSFYLDGKPFRILSGAIHYFRVPCDYWYDRLLKLKECGFNTVETYTCWNLHEPKEGKFDFSGNLDIARFIKTATSLGLYVILRPGPYICAEWEAGGLPAWLLTYEKMHIRCNDPLYLSKVENYFTALFGTVRPGLPSNGGNIIAVQIENEYGSYGDDKDYLHAIVDIYRKCAVDCFLYTADGTHHFMLSGGLLDGFPSASNFGANAKDKYAATAGMRPDQPDFCGEFWCGWFDHWGEAHHIREPEDIISNFREMLDYPSSVNLYMFHGGTNFGFTSGANCEKEFEPTVTSYDYNAPLSEAGDRTPLYYSMRDMICERFGDTGEMKATETRKCAYGKVKLTESAELLPQAHKLGKTVKSAAPLWSEELSQSVGYTLYSSEIRGGIHGLPLKIDTVHDRASVFLDGELCDSFYRSEPHREHTYEIADNHIARLDILCENMGRINYGPSMFDHKGISGVRFGQRLHFGWSMTALPMDNLSALEFSPFTGSCKNPVFLRGELEISGQPADTFLLLNGFHKGFVVINGHNIGRFWNDKGPQKTLYVPAPFLKKGKNIITVFESDGTDCDTVEFLNKPILG